MRVGCWVAYEVALLCHQQPDQLLSDAVSLVKSSHVEVVVPTPVSIFIVLNISVEDVEQGQMIAVRVRKLALCTICLLLLVTRPNEHIWNVKHGNHRKDFINTAVSV